MEVGAASATGGRCPPLFKRELIMELLMFEHGGARSFICKMKSDLKLIQDALDAAHQQKFDMSVKIKELEEKLE